MNARTSARAPWDTWIRNATNEYGGLQTKENEDPNVRLRKVAALNSEINSIQRAMDSVDKDLPQNMAFISGQKLKLNNLLREKDRLSY